MRNLRVSAAGVFLLMALLSPGPGTAQPSRQVAWENLAGWMENRLVPLSDLGVADCPAGTASQQPDRRVLQYIENVLYAWDEHDLGGGGFCVVLHLPREQTLSAAESQVLLSASGMWMEQAATALDSQELEPDDPRLKASPVGWVRPSSRAVPANPDLGIVGWAPRSGASGEREGEGRPGRSEIRRETGESVIGPKDDRSRITATGSFPYNSIAYLSFQTSGGPFRATGFLVSPYMVLTNGHVVWDEVAGRFVQNLEIAPGQTQDTPGGTVRRPFGSRIASRFATNAGWAETQRIEFDYSAAFFDSPFRDISTYMPLVFDVAPGAGGIVNVAGYPGTVRNEDTAALWHDDDVVASVQGRVLRHKVDTTGGNSGSPVWELFSGTGQRRAIAIHSSGDPLGVANSAARLVSQNYELIAEWLAWTPQTRRNLQLRINQIDASQCPAVRAIVSVTDATGKPVVDLVRQSFRLTENGVPQGINVSQAEVGNAPISVALVLDASSSLSDVDVQNIRVAARAFVDLLGSRDKLSVYHFANGVVRVQDYTTDKGAAKAAVSALNNDGGAVGDGSATALFDAIVEAADHSTQATGRRALVVMTDGQNNTGSSDSQDAIAAAQAAGVPVFTIGFGDAEVGILRGIADDTGGLFFYGASSADLQAILNAIGRALGNQYILSWLTNFISGGTQRIEVSVTDGGNEDRESDSYSQAGTSCVKPSTCSVQVLAPNGGETWTKGTQQTVRWTTSGPACGSVGVGISNGAEVWPLVDTTPNDGEQKFNVDFLPLGSSYRALVVDRATGAMDVSDNTLTLQAPAAGFTCAPNATTLCLGGGRFQVRVSWRAASSGVSSGRFAGAIPLTSAAGAFWFFDAAHPDLVVKALDGRSINSHFWFISGALSNVAYSIFLTDATTGESRVYVNPPGDLVSFADTSAFGPPPEEKKAEPAPLRSGSPTGPAPAPGTEEEPEVGPRAAKQTVLWSQTDSSGDTVVSSENRLDPGADAYDTEAADDFVVPARKSWDVQRVDVRGAYYGSGPRGPAASVNVVIYSDQAGVPTAALCSYSRLIPRAGLGSGSFSIDLPQSCRLVSGRYWLSVQANISFSSAGQWGWQERLKQQEKASLWRNPGDGYHTGCRSFSRKSACVGTVPDLLFELRGQAGNGGGGKCTASGTAVCLMGKRFKAEVSFFDANGKATAAKVVPITDSTAYSWFFASVNPELAIKIVDGRSVTGSFWVFYGGLTNQRYILKVTDTATGRVKTWNIPAGRFLSGADTQAFPGS